MPGVFWTLYHLLRDTAAYDKCRAQIDQVLSQRTNDAPAWFTLEELDAMTLVQSAFFETLRLRQVIFSARVVSRFCLQPQR